MTNQPSAQEVASPSLECRVLEGLALPDFAGRVGVDFRVEGFEGVTLRLCEARPLGVSQPAGGGAATPATPREPFELMFEGPKSPVLPQKIYRLEGAAMDPLEIFIVPIGPYRDGIGYQAIFS